MKRFVEIKKAAIFFAFAAASACAGAGPLSFDKLSSETKGEIQKEWLDQLGAKPDFAAACADQNARIKRLLEANPKAGEFAKAVEKANAAADPKERYFALRKVKRDIMFARLDFDKILCVDSPFPVGMEAPHESRVKTENTAAFGASLKTIDLSTPDYAETKLVGGDDCAITRASFDFDAKKIVFSMRQKPSPTYNLYTVNADGAGLKRLTESRYNDLDPTWLPDGDIVFVSTRSNHYIRCAGSGFRGTTLSRCKPDGKDIYFISTNNEADFMPSILDDGRIIYCRWEYVDKNIFRVQDFWTVNPDGTNPQIYWGGQSHWPDLKIGAMQIPGTEKCLFLASGHHNVFFGAVAILDPREGTNFPKGIWNLTPHLFWTEASKMHPQAPALPYNKDFSVPTIYNAFYSPVPLDSQSYLVSARRDECKRYVIDGDEFALYLADFDGNMELIKRGNHNIFYAQPQAKRKVPRVIPRAVEPLGDKPSPEAEAPKGFLYSANVYENSGIPPEKGKFLRVVEHCAPTYQDGHRNSGKEWRRVVMKLGTANDGLFTKTGRRTYCFLSGETSMSILVDESHKRILGEIPIEEDGSVNFELPSMKAVYFQILDKDKKVLQTMRSSTHVMPGERRGCLGCHATKIAKAPPRSPAKALRKPPQKLEKPFNDITFGFQRYIQPILDKRCVSCHGGSNPKTKLDLRGTIFAEGAPFTTSYVKLVFGVDVKPTKDRSVVNSIASPISCYYDYPSLETDSPETESVIAPMSVLTYVSPLVKRLEKGHCKDLSEAEFARLKAWIDLNCPFYGEEDVLATDDIDEGDFNNNAYPMFRGLAYAPKMRTCPDVDRAWRQDKYKTQADRLPKGADGKPAPAIIYEGEKRKVVGK